MTPPPPGFVSYYEINFEHILDVALRGVRRAAVFIGLGVNAAMDPAFKSFELTKFTMLRLVPGGLPPEVLTEVKENFRLWVEAAGFRELTETFGVFLDEVHRACSLALGFAQNQALTAEQVNVADERHTSFVGEGIPNKLNILQQRFGFSAQHVSELKSLNKARNCFAHRRGIVAAQDYNCEDALAVSWLGMDIVVVENETGNEHIIQVDSGDVLLEHGGRVEARFLLRVRRFTQGEAIKFSTRDLAEICWFYDREARTLCAKAIEYSKAAGVPMRDEPP